MFENGWSFLTTTSELRWTLLGTTSNDWAAVLTVADRTATDQMYAHPDMLLFG